MNLIVPMAGKSSRFPEMRPKWMLTHPNGRFMGIQAILGLNCEDFKSIVYIILKEHEEKFSFMNGFKDELKDLGLLDKTKFIILDKPTKDQPETVEMGIKLAKLEGPFTIKDSDNFFETTISPGNFVAFQDLNNSGLIKPVNKSYIQIDNNFKISNIIEKNVISSFFCVGSYSFESTESFLNVLDDMPKNKERYISNIIFQMILKGKIFSPLKVDNYHDWGTIEDWNRYKKTYGTLFVDIDGTLVINSSAHFPPYIGNTEPIMENVEILRNLYNSKKFKIILTTSRPEKYREATINQMNEIKMPFNSLIMDLNHSKRIVINDYSKTNPYKSCDSINLKRNSSDLKDILRDSIGIDFEQI
tara:strand:+ start:30702 stop:31778 length:1077 start_codon:yes stop_codon:yes gene_type:complete